MNHQPTKEETMRYYLSFRQYISHINASTYMRMVGGLIDATEMNQLIREWAQDITTNQ